MFEDILKYLITTAIGLLISVALWLLRINKRINDNTRQIEHLAELDQQRQAHTDKLIEQQARQLESLNGKIDAIQIMLMQMKKAS